MVKVEMEQRWASEKNSILLIGKKPSSMGQILLNWKKSIKILFNLPLGAYSETRRNLR
jgi:hypothetical protein